MSLCRRADVLSTGVQQTEPWAGERPFPISLVCPLVHLEAQCEREQMQGWDFGVGCAVSRQELGAMPFSEGSFPHPVLLCCLMSRYLDKGSCDHLSPPQRASPSKAISSPDFGKGSPGTWVFQKCEISCKHMQPAPL